MLHCVALCVALCCIVWHCVALCCIERTELGCIAACLRVELRRQVEAEEAEVVLAAAAADEEAVSQRGPSLVEGATRKVRSFDCFRNSPSRHGACATGIT